MKVAVIFSFIFFLIACNGTEKVAFDIENEKEALIPFHKKLGKPKNGDWLETHEEKNLAFEEYQALNPVRADEKRKVIYIQPIGTFDILEGKLIQTTAEYLKAFYGLETKILDPISDTIIPASNKREISHPVFVTVKEGNNTRQFWKDTLSEQLQTKYILNEMLKPNLPKDAVTMIAFCNNDLYPDESYNFVFGYASLKNRVGVWSFARFGDMNTEYEQVLLRTLKTASHETGHMFSIKHCSQYYCIMNGSNHLEEADGKPTYFCPNCLEKFCWNFNISPIDYFERVKLFWEKNGFLSEWKHYEKFISAIKKVTSEAN